MEDNNIRVAITHGDTNGIGYELIFKAFDDPAMFELCTPIVYGSPKVASYHRKALGMDSEANFSIISRVEEARQGHLNMLAAFDEEVKVEFGAATAESAKAEQKASERARRDIEAGLCDVLVYAPGKDASCQVENTITIYTSDDLQLAFVTSGLPLRDVAQAISKELVVEKARLLHQSLRRDFRLSNPRIAVLSLNPQPADEETTMLKPAVDELAAAGIQAFGPYSADDIFSEGLHTQFDAVLAMYDDQGLAPFKTIARNFGAKLIAGANVLMAATVLSPMYDTAGQGKADGQPLRNAIYMAIDAARNRSHYDEPLANPLPKLYHEKREDVDKARFNMPRNKDFKKKEE